MALGKRLRFRVLRRDGFTCRYCGRGAPDVPLEVDHVRPRSLGGSDHPDNLTTACADCNRGKGTLHGDATEQRVDEFIETWWRATEDRDWHIPHPSRTLLRWAVEELDGEVVGLAASWAFGQGSDLDALDYFAARLAEFAAGEDPWRGVRQPREELEDRGWGAATFIRSVEEDWPTPWAELVG